MHKVDNVGIFVDKLKTVENLMNFKANSLL